MMVMNMMRRVCDVIKPNEQRLRASYTFTFLKVILTSGRQSKASFICCYYSIAFLGSFSLFIPSAMQPSIYISSAQLVVFISFILFIHWSFEIQTFYLYENKAEKKNTIRNIRRFIIFLIHLLLHSPSPPTSTSYYYYYFLVRILIFRSCYLLLASRLLLLILFKDDDDDVDEPE